MILILNIITAAIPIYFCIRFNKKKRSFFYTFVFTLLITGIICNLPFTLVGITRLFSDLFKLRCEPERIILFIMDIFPYTILLPVGLGIYFPLLHIIPFFLSFILITKHPKCLTKKHIHTIIVLNLLYYITAAAAEFSLMLSMQV